MSKITAHLFAVLCFILALSGIPTALQLWKLNYKNQVWISWLAMVVFISWLAYLFTVASALYYAYKKKGKKEKRVMRKQEGQANVIVNNSWALIRMFVVLGALTAFIGYALDKYGWHRPTLEGEDLGRMHDLVRFCYNLGFFAAVYAIAEVFVVWSSYYYTVDEQRQVKLGL